MLENWDFIERIHEGIGEVFVVLLVLTCTIVPGAVLLAVVRGQSTVRRCCAQIAITWSIMMFVAYLGNRDPEIFYGAFFQPASRLVALGLIIGITAALVPRWQPVAPLSATAIISEMKSSWKLSAISVVIAAGLLAVLMQVPIWDCTYHWEYVCNTYGGDPYAW